MVPLLCGPRRRGGGGPRAQAGGVASHVHLETTELWWQTLVHVKVVIRLTFLLEDLVKHRGTLPGGESVGD